MSKKQSDIGRRLKQTGDLLVDGAQRQVTTYKHRFSSLEGVSDWFLSGIIVPYSNGEIDTEFLDKFFGKRALTFAGIDGTVCKYDVFDMVIFFAGAYSAHGIARVKDSKSIALDYDEKYLERGMAISSVLPLYIYEVPIVDHTLLTRGEDGEIDDSATLSDAWIIDNSAVAERLMTLSEYYLAYKLVSSDDPVDILLLDRICSGEIAHSYARTSQRRINLKRECGLIGAKVGGRFFSTTDWIYARRLFGNMALGTPSARGEYLLPRIIIELLLEGDRGLTRSELVTRLELDSETREARLDRALKRGMKDRSLVEGIILEEEGRYSIKPEYCDIRARMKQLVDETCERIFSEDPSISFEDRFKIDSRWLTTNDMSFLTLMCVYLMIESCWKNPTLMVGVAKDTSSRDLTRKVIPVLNHVGIFDKGFGERTQEVPDTDRMILQWVSLHDKDRLTVPWATFEYDTAFKTIAPHFENKKGVISGARRYHISLEKTFVKSYFQLCQAKTNDRLRSNALMYDRLVYPKFDTDEGQLVTLKHEYQRKTQEIEPVEVVLYIDKPNPIQAFTVKLFEAMTSMSIPELFGHIKPLYVADKVAKFYYEQFRRMVESTGSWLSKRPELREFLFYLSSFRERRSEIERDRRT